MKFTVESILDQLPEEGVLETKKLEKILKLTKKQEREQLDLALIALQKIGIIKSLDNSSIGRIEDETLLECRLRCSSKGYCFAIRDDEGEDIYIRDHNLNNGWNGDRVLVRVNKEGIRRKSPEGAVQCILERANGSLLCLIEKQDSKLIANPLDERINTYIQLKDTDISHLENTDKDCIYEIKIDTYPVAQYIPEGHIVRALPLNGGSNSDVDILLTKNNLNEEVNSPRSSLKAPSNKKRLDLSNQKSILLNSWQSNDAPPLFAVFAEPKDGGIKLWIHTPAISERLTIGNSLDNWIRDRGESHCLGNNWKTLLNKTLTQECKFETGIVNDAISVALEVNAEGEVTDWEFILTKIKPAASIDSEILKSIVSRKPKARTIPAALKPYKDHIDQIKTIIYAAELISNFENNLNSVKLDIPVPKIESLMDLQWQEPDNNKLSWQLELDKEDPNSILCIFSICANRAWAQHINELGISGLIIDAPGPDNNALNEVAKSALALDIQIKLNDDGNLTSKNLVNSFENSLFKRVLQQQLTYCYSEPKIKRFLTSDKQLGSDQNEDLKESKVNTQSPWVNPSLHYSDLINQFIISLLLTEGKASATTRSKNKVLLGKKGASKDINWEIFNTSINKSINSLVNDSLISKINNRRRKAKNLRNDMISLAQARTTEKLVGQEVEGIISGVQSYGFFVELPTSLAEGLVHVSSLNDDWYEYRSRQNKLVGRKNRRAFHLGESVQVKVIKVDFLRNQIDLEIANDKIDNLDNDNQIKARIDNNIPDEE